MAEDPFEQVVREHWDRIYRAARLLLDDPTEAEDLVQTVFVQAWRGFGRFEGRSQVYTWLYGILLRCHRRQCRRRWWRDRLQGRTGPLDQVQDPIADDRAGPDTAARAADDIAELRAVMQRVSPKLREVLVLRYSEGLSIDDIATALDLPSGTVKSRLNLARQAVATHLRQRGWS